MTVELFITLFGIGSMLSSLLTEALKKTYRNISSNVIALVNAAAVGCLGTFSHYILADIPLTPKNILCAILMSICIWVGSMVGYDKVMQTLRQIRG